MRKQNVEEILEALWMCREEGREPCGSDLLERAHGDSDTGDLEEAIEAGLLTRVGEGLAFSPSGEEQARSLIRRHRLAERLLVDVLQIGVEGIESSACGFEHVLSPEVTDSICTLLGHPTVCPHRLSIPPGGCCGKLARETGPVVRRLSDVAAGERVRVAFIATGKDKRLERLGAFGVHPGAELRLTQRRPSYILEVDQTSLAIEKEVADGIYVHRAPEDGARS